MTSKLVETINEAADRHERKERARMDGYHRYAAYENIQKELTDEQLLRLFEYARSVVEAYLAMNGEINNDELGSTQS